MGVKISKMKQQPLLSPPSDRGGSVWSEVKDGEVSDLCGLLGKLVRSPWLLRPQLMDIASLAASLSTLGVDFGSRVALPRPLMANMLSADAGKDASAWSFSDADDFVKYALDLKTLGFGVGRALGSAEGALLGALTVPGARRLESVIVASRLAALGRKVPPISPPGSDDSEDLERYWEFGVKAYYPRYALALKRMGADPGKAVAAKKKELLAHLRLDMWEKTQPAERKLLDFAEYAACLAELGVLTGRPASDGVRESMPPLKRFRT